MTKPYQIDKQWAAQKFCQLAGEAAQPPKLAIALPDVVAPVQQGLMSLALAAFTQLAEQMMQWEVGALVGLWSPIT